MKNITKLIKCRHFFFNFYTAKCEKIFILKFQRNLSTNQSQNLNENSTQIFNQSDSLLNKYNETIEKNLFKKDPHQLSVVTRLNEFHKKAICYNPHFNEEKKGIFYRFKQVFSKSDEKVSTPTLKGVYLYGGVGCGKTFLMDLVYNTLPQDKLKMRIHFNKFMLDVHKNIHEIKSSNKESKNYDYDPLTILANDLIKKVNLLFFDEFQITDIADAMLMSRLFTALFDKGMVVFCTSNRIPNDLYKNGLQRELFEPFIDIIYQYCDVINLDSPIDYRKLSNISAANRVYFNSEFENHLLDNVVAKLLDKNSDSLTGFREMSLEVLGRQIKLERTHNRILDTTFAFICEENRSSVDYLEFCKLFDVIVLRDIPFINMKHLDTLRRFIVFVDTVYDNKVKLIFSGKASSPQLCFDLSVKNFTLSKTDSSSNKQPTNFIQEEYFAVDRTISRLIEMQSESYIEQTKR